MRIIKDTFNFAFCKTPKLLVSGYTDMNQTYIEVHVKLIKKNKTSTFNLMMAFCFHFSVIFTNPKSLNTNHEF